MSRFKAAGTTEHGYFEERISAYLDGELTPRETEAVEHHLGVCPACQWELDTLRQTMQWTQELPTLTVPRVFTIPVPAEPDRSARRRWNFLPVLQGATALIAVLLVFAVAGDFIFGGMPAGRAPDTAYEEAASISVAATQAVEKVVEEPAAEPEMMLAETVIETVVETVVLEGEVAVSPTEAPLALDLSPTALPAAAEASAPEATAELLGTENAWRGVEGEATEEGIAAESDAGATPVEEGAVAGGGEPTLAMPAPSSPISATEPSTVASQLALAPEVERDDEAAEAAPLRKSGINWLRILEYSLGGVLVLLVAATIFFTVERRRSQ